MISERDPQLTLDENGTQPVIGTGAVRALFIDPTKLDRTSADRVPTSPAVANTGQVLLHAVGSNRGQAAVVVSEFEGYFISRNIIILSVTELNVLPAYLAITLNSRFVKQQLDVIATGAVLLQLSIGKLRDILIPVPDIPTQKQIIERVTQAQAKLIDAEQQVLLAEATMKNSQASLQDTIDHSWDEGENG